MNEILLGILIGWGIGMLIFGIPTALLYRDVRRLECSAANPNHLADQQKE